MAKMVAASAAVALATACSAPAPGLVKADGVERVSVDGAAYAAEYRSFRDSALGLGHALLADGGDGSGGNVVSSPEACWSRSRCSEPAPPGKRLPSWTVLWGSLRRSAMRR